jgi:hypothetical protein
MVAADIALHFLQPPRWGILVSGGSSARHAPPTMHGSATSANHIGGVIQFGLESI